jgi:DNA-binding MarR family transcriptional regulator
MLRSRSSDVKPLSPTEIRQENVDTLFMVWLVARSTQDLLDSVLGPAGLSADDFAIYSILAAAPGITPTELARWMATAPTTVSSFVKRFETRGHLARQPHPQDRRSYRLRLTPAGKRAHRRASVLFAPVRAQVAHALEDEQIDAREGLLQLRSVIDQIREATEQSALSRSR